MLAGREQGVGTERGGGRVQGCGDAPALTAGPVGSSGSDADHG